MNAYRADRYGHPVKVLLTEGEARGLLEDLASLNPGAASEPQATTLFRRLYALVFPPLEAS